VFDYDSSTGKASNKKVLFSLPGGGLHFSRTVGIGPDKKLYVAIGSSCNVCIEKDERRSAILQSDLDGKNVHVFAKGLRNTVFFTWDASGTMWGNDMGRDNLGDDTPPDEINKIESGKNYGWPYCYGENMHDEEFDNKNGDVAVDNVCEALGMVGSTINHPAHSAPLGIAIIPSTWPQEYQGDMLVAYHGSWNRTTPTGYKIVRIKRNALGQSEGIEDFISGWLSSGGTLGRPVDVVFSSNGDAYITDDKAGNVYRLTILQ
jgi:glucose/arabinose dehydrogenase